MECLGGELNEWQSSLPHNLRPSVHAMLDIKPRTPPRKQNIIRLHYLYYSSVIALNANFHYPWVASVLLNKKESLFQDHIFQSSKRAAEAARQILIMLRNIEPDMASPSP